MEALEIFDGKLVAGGDFTIAGGRSARFVAAWDGSGWSAVGEGLDSMVYALVAFEGRLVAGGPFLSAGSRCARGIAYWDGDGWKPMGTGVNGFVLELAGFGGQLFAGGSFTRAGGTASFGIARWSTFHLLVPVVLGEFIAVRSGGGEAVISWEVIDARDHAGFHVYRETEGEERIRLTETLLRGRTRYEFVDPDPPGGPASYWLADVSRTGELSWYGPAPLAAAVPSVLALQAVRPNPFRGTARIDYTLPGTGGTMVTVFDVQGRTVATLVNETQPAGAHTLSWDGTDERGERLAQGLYFLRLGQDGRSVTQRVLLLP